MQIHAYLTFPGTCEEAFTFYKTALKGEISMMMKHEEAPDGADEVPVEWRGKIIHAALKVDDTVIMGADMQAAHYQAPTGLNVSLAIKNAGRADKIFAALSEDGNVTMPLQKTFWAQKFGMVTDKFGTPWMINCE